jgi:ABC-2 type transport system ATP-binding protein
MNKNNELVRASALNRIYGNQLAVSDIDLVLHRGEVLGLLGPNGAGKSTTMQMLTGNLSPTSGEIIINGMDMLDNPQRAKRSIGYLPEQPPVYRDMTVKEYLSYCAMLRDVPKTKRASAVDSAMQRCSLNDVSNRLIANLSKGFQQRVGIAQAILHSPKVVILDEPTVGLDPIQIKEIRHLIRQLGNDHSVILSTHILPEVQAVCDRVQIIHQGKTVFSDTFEALAKRQSSPVLVVGFEQTGDDVFAALKNISEISSVEKLPDGRYKIEFRQQLNPSVITRLANQQGWQLTELTPYTETLEQIFMDLIHGEESDLAIEPGNNEIETGEAA